MKKNLTLILLLITFSFGLLYAQDTNTEGTKNGPLIKFDMENYDFEQVIEGNNVTHVFKFTNIGNDTLKIKRVDGGWGCTAALLSSESIAPGDSGEIKVTFMSKNRTGKNVKTVYVYSNDKEKTIRKLHISVEVLAKEEDIEKS